MNYPPINKPYMPMNNQIPSQFPSQYFPQNNTNLNNNIPYDKNKSS